jgi:NAD+ synthase
MSLEPKFDQEHLQVIKQYITAKVTEAIADGVVIGVSGGLDSAVVLKICTMIFTPDKISAVFLPESTTPPQDARDIKIIAKNCKIDLIEIKIDPILKTYLQNNNLPKPEPIALGNLKARIRMNILFLIANSLNHIVLGTSNKSEFLLGYFTKFGDGASDVAPLGDLYKTQVIKLAEYLKLPKNIISKPPTAGLVADQTDEDDLGMDYKTIDKILFGLERDMPTAKLASALDLSEKEVMEIKHRVESNRHKRKFTKIPKLGLKTIGVDLYE